MSYIEMYDSVDVNTVPTSGVQGVAGYVAGNWPTYSSLAGRYPGAKHCAIAIRSDEQGDALDVEQGDASPSDAPSFFRNHRKINANKPIFYANLSTAPAVVNALTSAGIQRDKYYLWTAHPNNVPHVCPASHGAAYGLQTNADLTQWTWNAMGRNLDESLVQDYVFGPPPPPPDPYHYNWFINGKFSSKWGALDERDTVLHYDGARKHPVKYYWYLKKLRAELDFLARRVSYVAHADPDSNGHPSWEKFRRGWRYQELADRAQGKKIAS